MAERADEEAGTAELMSLGKDGSVERGSGQESAPSRLIFDQMPSEKSALRRHPLVLGLVVIAVVILLSRLHLLAVRVYDPDEFEHLHAAYCVARGMIPYRDFFEHHPPLAYYLSAPLVLAAGAEPILLTLNRLLSYGFVLATLVGTWKVAQRIGGARVAAMSVLGLVTMPWFAEKSIEWRPDVPAMALIVWSAWFSIRSSTRRLGAEARSHSTPRRADAIATGICLGLALLLTPKVLFLAGGLVVAGAWHKRSCGESFLRWLVTTTIAAAIPLIACAAILAAMGAASAALRCLVLYPLTWPEHPHDPEATFFAAILGHKNWAPAHFTLGFAGLAIGTLRFASLRAQRRGEIICSLPALVHFFAVPIVPAVYLQYYLPALPLTAVAAAIAIALAGRSLFRRWDKLLRTFRRLLVALSAVLIMLPIVLTLGGMREPFRWMNFARPNPYATVDLAAAALLVAAAVLIMLHRRWGLAAVWIALLVPSIGRTLIPHSYWPNDAQRRELARVHEVVPPDEPVLDGFTGYGCLRPHAAYWWWINEHSLPLAEREGGIAEIAAAVATKRPALVILDRELARLLPVIGPSLEENYRPLDDRPTGGVALLIRK